MDDVERAVDDAINTFKALTRDPRFVPGAGATEIELAKQLADYGEVSLMLSKRECTDVWWATRQSWGGGAVRVKLLICCYTA